MKLETIAAGVLSASFLTSFAGEQAYSNNYLYQENKLNTAQQIEKETTDYDQAIEIIRNFLDIENSSSTLLLYEKIVINPSETIEIKTGFDIPGNTSPIRKLYIIRLIDEKSGLKSDHWTMQLVVDKTISGENIANLAIAIDKDFNYFDGNIEKLAGNIPTHVLGTISDNTFNIPAELKKAIPDRTLLNSKGELIALEKRYTDTEGNLFIQGLNGNMITFQAPFPIPEGFSYEKLKTAPNLGPKPNTA